MMKLSPWHQLLFAFALGLLAASPLHAQSPSSSADKPGSAIAAGIAAYAQAQAATDRDSRLAGFARAQAHFSAAANAGSASADLFANIGTAALQSERLGDAIVAFRRALAIDPDHDRATRNLGQARKLLPEWVPKPASGTVLDSFFFWHRTWSTAERAYGAAWCFLFAAIAFGHRIRVQQPPGQGAESDPHGRLAGLERVSAHRRDVKCTASRRHRRDRGARPSFRLEQCAAAVRQSVASRHRGGCAGEA